MATKTVRCPPPFEDLFVEAEKYVSKYFGTREDIPETGSIIIGGERYFLVRAASMSVHFVDFVKNMYPVLNERESIEAATKVLFDIANNIGGNDAKAFHQATGVTDPIAKLSTGPVHFAHSGWAFVDISAESNPTPDNDYFLLYDHPQSFESDSWIQLRGKTDFCTCVMNAGYSSGWCSESFSIDLIAREILCRAKGDPCCRFIMAPPRRIQAHVDRYVAQHPELFPSR
jgi:two-component system, cell cycle sensor histidine kinase and response regulator CckA